MTIANITLARPYAKAAFAHANETKNVPEWLYFLEYVTFIVLDPEVHLFLQNPQQSRENHQAFLSEMLKNHSDETQLNFLKELLTNRRLQLLPEIMQLFKELLAEQENTLNVEVISKYPLTETQQQTLIEKLEKRWQQKIKLILKEDERLLGGIIVKAGDRVIDGTLHNQLHRLQQQLVGI